MKKEQRFWESWSERSQSWTTRWAGSWMCDRSRPSASIARKRWRMAPWRGSLPSSSRHSLTAGGSSVLEPGGPPFPSILTVSNGVAFETTAFFALTTLPFFSRTPTARPFSTRISSTCAFIWILPPNFSRPRTIVLAISSVPPRGTQYCAVSSKKRSRMYKMCAVIAPLAGKPQKMHMVSIQLRRKGSVTISSTVSWRDWKTSGRSGRTHGFDITKGAPPAVVARKPASWRRLRRETADMVPHRSLSLLRKAYHCSTARSPSVAWVRRVSTQPPGRSALPMGKRQYPWGVQYPRPV
mmetsp:Transcript_7476/g.23144  ORF Transcript_7476/g.23144 Transcript_7476/m.23144 type:complete len:296 (-) Transcript_7476:619-1506(-)